jgi:hypothetical protein
MPTDSFDPHVSHCGGELDPHLGSTRSIPSPVVDLLCQLKDDEPALTIPLLIGRVREQHRDAVSDEVTLPESTVHRLLARRGLA